jgi:hypothetical protein
LPDEIHAVYRLDVNEYNGLTSLQLVVEHWQTACRLALRVACARPGLLKLLVGFAPPANLLKEQHSTWTQNA